MDANSFFNYPTAEADEPGMSSGLLDQGDERDWDSLLAAMQTLVLRPGDIVIAEGRVDRALYLLTDGVLELGASGSTPAEVAAPPAQLLNEIAFLDGGGCTATAQAVTNARVLRLSFDAFEALAAREPHLARHVAVDLARMLARRVRHSAGQRG
jgi:CRP/FNR family transcriptional regulator, cyclic AMP receptor protein